MPRFSSSLYPEILQEDYLLSCLHSLSSLTVSMGPPPQSQLRPHHDGRRAAPIRSSVPWPHLTGSLDVASHSLSLETLLALGFWSLSILILVRPGRLLPPSVLCGSSSSP